MHEKTLTELSEALAARKISARELTEHYLERRGHRGDVAGGNHRAPLALAGQAGHLAAF